MTKSTIEYVYLNCTQCACTYWLSAADYKRRLSKLPTSENFFCSRKCGGTWRSANVVRPPNPNPTHLRDYRAKHGITNQKYDPAYIWYANRIAKDAREHAKTQLSRKDIIEMLDQAWKHQQGLCIYTGVPLTRRSGQAGVCGTANPFEIASVDRIDCDLPYQPGNVQWTSVALNLARGNTPHRLFEACVQKFRGRT